MTGETSSLDEELEVLSVSKRLVRSLSQKLKRKKVGSDTRGVGVALRCPRGCKVGAATSEEFGDMGCRRSSSEEGKAYKPVCGAGEDTNMDCFWYGAGVKEKLWKRSNRKLLMEVNHHDVFLPDDIVEMCLVRLPLTSLMKARLVCKKWRNLTTTPRFTQMRREGLYQSPWLFLFGSVKDGYCSTEIHALDVSLNKWHKVESQLLKGRFFFSVTSIRDDVYIVGGCSSLTNLGKMDTSAVNKTHKGVLVFSPLTKSWHKVASMKHARSKPILGVYEVVNSDCLVIKSQDRRFPRTRIGGTSDVYEDPHRLSVRRRQLDETTAKASYYREKREQLSVKGGGCTRFLLIAVGGVGSWEEPLDSCEVYDSSSNKWTEIQRLPNDFGVACSAVVCSGVFYVYSETDSLAAYDIERGGGGFWMGIQTSNLPARVHEYYPKLISCEGRVFMVSVSWCEGDGEIGRRNKAVRKVWELDLMHDLNWTEVSTHPDAPMDWNAAFVADKKVILGVEMFKIFGQVMDFFTLFHVSDDAHNKWIHISRNQVARHHHLDAASCLTKSVALLHL